MTDLIGTTARPAAVGRHRLERGTGSVIDVASVAGLEATPSLAG
jgi:short-subunit dehydrogenase